jgi:Glycosyltransferase family 17.
LKVISLINPNQGRLKFNAEKFSLLRDKIIYLINDKEFEEIETINKEDTEDEKSRKYIFNGIHRENSQRNFINEGIKIADNDDLILISDVDEIPNLKNIDLRKIKEKLIFFNQEMFYYKFNLKFPNYNWVGTKLCKKKYLKFS